MLVFHFHVTLLLILISPQRHQNTISYHVFEVISFFQGKVMLRLVEDVS